MISIELLNKVSPNNQCKKRLINYGKYRQNIIAKKDDKDPAF